MSRDFSIDEINERQNAAKVHGEECLIAEGYGCDCGADPGSPPVEPGTPTALVLSPAERRTLRALLEAHRQERDGLSALDLEDDAVAAGENWLSDAELAALIGRLGGR